MRHGRGSDLCGCTPNGGCPAKTSCGPGCGLSSGVSQWSGLLSQALVRFDKRLEGHEASVALGSVERRPRVGLISADSSYNLECLTCTPL